MKLTLVLLTRNEIAGVRALLDSIPFHMVDEVFAVDGGSTDGTVEEFRKHGVRVVNQQSKGRGEAFRIAMAEATGDAVILFSPDGNENPKDILRFRPLLEEGYDLVIASRMMRGAQNEEDGQRLKWRKWANNAFNVLANLAFRRRGPFITDSINGFRAVRKDAFERLHLDGTGFTIEYQMTMRALRERLRIVEFPTHEASRIGGESGAKAIPTGMRFVKVFLQELFSRRIAGSISPHPEKGWLYALLYAVRNFRSRRMFAAMRKHCRGEVLDVGGFDFILTAKVKGIPFDRWTTLDPSVTTMPAVDDPRFRYVTGDGCDMRMFPPASFDTVLCIQVVEHVFEPIRMVEEIARVLKPGGIAIFLVPQTSTLHFAPHHYYNFTRYWVTAAMERAKLTIVELEALGGRWSSMASHLVYFFIQAARSPGTTVPEERRGALFYVLYPFMAIAALALIPLFLLFSFGDLREEPNNHLVVVRKPAA